MIEKFKVKIQKPERDFVKVYKDFLRNKLLTVEEKMIYISLKYFVEYGKDKGSVYPSMETLCELSSLSKPRATKAISNLIEKGIVKKNRRGLTKTNEYTLMDDSLIWKSKNIEELKIKVEEIENNFVNLSEVSTEMLLKELERRNKEKEPETTEQLTKAPVETSPKPNQSDVVNTDKVNTTVTNTTPDLRKSQDSERYTLEQIRQLYEYDIMVADEPTKQNDIDTVIEILHTTLNTTKNTIRVGRENKPTMSVISKLMKLDKDCILYAIEKFGEQTERIKNPTNYMLTLLYNAKEQMNLDITNKVQFDMYNNNNAMCDDDSTSSNSDVKNYKPPEQQEPKQATKASRPNTTNRFNQFPQREYDMEDLEKMLLRRQKE